MDWVRTHASLLRGATRADQGRTKCSPSRVKFCSDNSLQVTQELLEHISSQETRLAVDCIVKHKFDTNMKAYVLLVQWKELEPVENSWELLCTKLEDVRRLVSDYITTTQDEAFQGAAQGGHN